MPAPRCVVRRRGPSPRNRESARRRSMTGIRLIGRWTTIVAAAGDLSLDCRESTWAIQAASRRRYLRHLPNLRMRMFTAHFSGHEIRVLDLAPHGLLLNTVDVCSILGIPDRQPGTDLGQPCLDLVTATNLAIGRNQDFVEWLIETFDGHPVETMVRPICDDDWSNLPGLDR